MIVVVIILTGHCFIIVKSARRNCHYESVKLYRLRNDTLIKHLQPPLQTYLVKSSPFLVVHLEELVVKAHVLAEHAQEVDTKARTALVERRIRRRIYKPKRDDSNNNNDDTTTTTTTTTTTNTTTTNDNNIYDDDDDDDDDDDNNKSAAEDCRYIIHKSP